MINGNNNYNNYSEVLVPSSTMAMLMRKVFVWMAAALGVTGLTSLFVVKSTSFIYFLAGNSQILWLLMIAELIMVMVLAARINKMSFTTATVLFFVYAVLNGVTLSPIFLIYTASSIAKTFFITAGMFAAMAAIGYTTKRDLSKWRSIFTMALIGLIIAIIVNIFLKSSMMDFIISIVGVIIFTGLTAYDVNKIKQLFQQSGGFEDETTNKIAILGSLTLYLDFINLFLYLLRFFGSRD